MKEPEIVVGEVKIGELRKRLRQLLEMRTPRIVYRNSRSVGVLFSIEPSWDWSPEIRRKTKCRLRAELEAVFAKLER